MSRCLPPVLSGWTQTARSSCTSPQQQQLWDSTETRRNLSESAVCFFLPPFSEITSAMAVAGVGFVLRLVDNLSKICY